MTDLKTKCAQLRFKANRDCIPFNSRYLHLNTEDIINYSIGDRLLGAKVKENPDIKLGDCELECILPMIMPIESMPAYDYLRVIKYHYENQADLVNLLEPG